MALIRALPTGRSISRLSITWFRSLTHFNRVFCKLLAESPTSYRSHLLPLYATLAAMCCYIALNGLSDRCGEIKPERKRVRVACESLERNMSYAAKHFAVSDRGELTGAGR
jgi:hypothetical protein